MAACSALLVDSARTLTQPSEGSRYPASARWVPVWTQDADGAEAASSAAKVSVDEDDTAGGVVGFAAPGCMGGFANATAEVDCAAVKDEVGAAWAAKTPIASALISGPA